MCYLKALGCQIAVGAATCKAGGFSHLRLCEAGMKTYCSWNTSRRPVPKSCISFFSGGRPQQTKNAKIGGDLSFHSVYESNKEDCSDNVAKVPRKDMQTCIDIFETGCFQSQICHISNGIHVNCDRRHHNIVFCKQKPPKNWRRRKKRRVYSEHWLFRHAWHFISFEHLSSMQNTCSKSLRFWLECIWCPWKCFVHSPALPDGQRNTWVVEMEAGVSKFNFSEVSHPKVSLL